MQYTYGMSVYASAVSLLTRGILLWNLCSGSGGSGISIDWVNYIGSTPSSQIISTDNGNSANYFSFYTRTTNTGNSAQPQERIRINTDGNILVSNYLSIANGATTPIYPLDFGSADFSQLIALSYNGSGTFYGVGTQLSGANTYYQVPSSGLHNLNIGGTSIFSLNSSSFTATQPIQVSAAVSTYGITFALYNQLLGVGSNENILFGVSTSNLNCGYINYTSSNTLSTGAIGIYGASTDAFNFGANYYLGINNITPSFPLDVMGDSGNTFTLNFPYYVNSFHNTVFGPANGYSGPFSCRIQGYVYAFEFWGLSDVRLKTDIVDLSSVISAQHFLESVEPKTYKWKDESETTFGYIAQDVFKQGYFPLVQATPDPDLEELIDEDFLCSPAGTVLHITYEKVVPILHLSLLELQGLVEDLENKL